MTALAVLALVTSVEARPSLALQGGGIRALASDAGLLAGLAAARGLEPRRRRNFGGAFGATSSCSGSSWFAAELFYSEKFVELMEGMASSPSTAAKQFQEAWIRPWLLATNVDESKFDGLQSVVRLMTKLLLGTGDEDTIFLTQFFLATGLSWDHFVDVLLNSTAGLGNVTLAAPVTSAAQGVWLVDHTLLLPQKPASLAQGKLLLPHVTYSVKTQVPSFLPAKFSVKLGAGEQPAPYPYIGPQLPIQFAYRSFPFASEVSPALDLDHLGRGLRGPLRRMVGASSAILAVALTSGAAALGVAELDAEVAVWLGTEGFQAAEEVVEQLRGGAGGRAAEGRGAGAGGGGAWEQLAVQGVHALMDGGFSDGTGIAWAFTTSDEVVAVLNSFSTNQAEYVTQLFPGGRVVKPQVPPELFPVFQAPNASQVTAAFERFDLLQVAEGSQYLKVLAVGSIQATLAENPFFGLVPREVTLHVINICSELSIGFFANFVHYGDLVQDIILTISDVANRDLVRSKLLPLFGEQPTLV